MKSPPINWNKVADALSAPLIFLAAYLAAEAANIAVILYGIDDKYVLVKCGWVIGLLCGVTVVYFVSVRPKNKLVKDYETLTDDMLGIIRHQHIELEMFRQLNQKRRIEGDEWKDG